MARCNKYIDEMAPWNLAKDPENESRLHTVLYVMAESLRQVVIMCTPFMPLLPERVWHQLNIEDQPSLQTWDSLQWGLLPAGVQVKRGASLFPRIESEEKLKDRAKETKGKTKEKNQSPEKEPVKDAENKTNTIKYEDFAKLDLRVARVIEAKKVEKADKLLELRVDLGQEQRTIVAGVAQHYRRKTSSGKGGSAGQSGAHEIRGLSPVLCLGRVPGLTVSKAVNPAKSRETADRTDCRKGGTGVAGFMDKEKGLGSNFMLIDSHCHLNDPQFLR